jgi:hypothetical protein
MSGPSSHLMPSHLRPSSTPSSDSLVLRSRSVLSILSTNVPPYLRAKSMLYRAVRAVPTWQLPVGEGAILTLTFPSLDDIESAFIGPKSAPLHYAVAPVKFSLAVLMAGARYIPRPPTTGNSSVSRDMATMFTKIPSSIESVNLKFRNGRTMRPSSMR